MSRPWLILLFSLLVATQSLRALAEDVEDEEYADAERALLIVRKFIKESSAVQGRNITISVSLYNAGQSSALSAQVEDGEIPESFKLVSGSTKATFERIPVGSNITLEYVVVPTGAEGSVLLKPATVKYQAEMESEQYQVGRSNLAGVYVLTPSQHIQNQLLYAGSYVTLGLCKAPSDWRNLAIGVVLLTVLLGGNWSYKKVTSAKQKWNREKNLKDFGLDSEDEATKKQSRKARRQTVEDKEN